MRAFLDHFEPVTGGVITHANGAVIRLCLPPEPHLRSNLVNIRFA